MGYLLKDEEKWVYNDGNDNGIIILLDGSFRKVGTSKVFEDIIGDVMSKRLLSATGRVDYDTNENAIKMQPGGDITNPDDRIPWNVQLPHGSVIGDNSFFKMHFHYWQADTTKRVLTLQYRIQNNGLAKDTIWKTLEVKTSNGYDVFTYSSGTVNQITTFAEIDISGCDISSTLQFRMARTDSETGDLNITFIDAHVGIDSDGSMSEWSKDSIFDVKLTKTIQQAYASVQVTGKNLVYRADGAGSWITFSSGTSNLPCTSYVEIQGIDVTQFESVHTYTVTDQTWLKVELRSISSVMKTFANICWREEQLTDFTILDTVDTKNIRYINAMFSANKELINLDLGEFKIKALGHLNHMFHYCEKLTSVDLSNVDVSEITSMVNTFYKAYKLESINLGIWDTNNCTDFTSMFNYTSSTVAGNVCVTSLGDFITNTGSTTTSMFDNTSTIIHPTTSEKASLEAATGYSYNYNCSAAPEEFEIYIEILSNVDHANIYITGDNLQYSADGDTYQSFSSGRTSISCINNVVVKGDNVTYFTGNNVIDGVYTFKNVELRKISDTMTSFQVMFKYENGLYSATFLDTVNTINITDIDQMFYYCLNLEIINGINNFNTINVTNMASVFATCVKLKELDISNWDTRNVIFFSGMFFNTAFTELDLSTFDTSRANHTNQMFGYMTNLTKLDLRYWDLSLGYGYEGMFENTGDPIKGCCVNALNNFTTTTGDSVTDMFLDSNLTHPDASEQASLLAISGYVYNHNCVPITDDTEFEIYIERLGTLSYIIVNITGDNLYYNADGKGDIAFTSGTAVQLPCINNVVIKGTNVTVFKGNNSATVYTFKNVELRKVSDTMTAFNQMFKYEKGLLSFKTKLSLNTINITNIDEMFYDCTLLESADLYYMNTINVETMQHTFAECTYLTSIDLNNFNTLYVTSFFGMFDDVGSASTGCCITANNNFITGSGTTVSNMFLDSNILHPTATEQANLLAHNGYVYTYTCS